MKKIALLTAFIITGLAASLRAQPAYLNYQGRLSDAVGAPLTNGTYALEFNIFDAANGGSNVWGPFLFDGNGGNGHAPRVVVLQGRFNVILGPVGTTTPIARPLQDAFAGASRFVEIRVDGGAPILPRQQFLSSPYAFKAFSATNADKATFATAAASVTDANVAYRNTANTFTGNQTVNGNVSATGDVTAGGKSVAVGEENLRVVRGIVRGTTASGLNRGTGWTVTSFGGTTVINFATSFLDLPAVTVTAEGAPEAWHFSVAVTNSSVTVTSRRSDGVVQALQFHFIAIGPR